MPGESRVICRLRRWWWVTLLRARGWPDPEGALDWLERRWEIVLRRTENDE